MRTRVLIVPVVLALGLAAVATAAADTPAAAADTPAAAADTPAAAADTPAAAAPAAAPAWSVGPTAPMSSGAAQGLLNQIAVLPAGQVFAAGYLRTNLPGASEVRTMVQRWTGTAWEAMATPDVETAPAADYLYGIDGSSATDVWAVGRSATGPGVPTGKPLALHYDGSAWRIVPVPDPSGGRGADMSAFVSTGRNSGWAVGTAYPLEAMGAVYRLDAGTWSSVRLPLLPGCRGSNFTQLTAVTATPDGDVYAGGDCPTATGRSGFVVKMVSPGQWQVVARMGGTSNVADLTAAADGTVWATGTLTRDGAARSFLLYGSDTTWKRRVRPAPADQGSEVGSGVAVTPAGITVVGETDSRNGARSPFVATWDGLRWRTSAVTPAPAGTEWLTAVAGSATGPVWATGHYLDDRARIIPVAAHP